MQALVVSVIIVVQNFRLLFLYAFWVNGLRIFLYSVQCLPCIRTCFVSVNTLAADICTVLVVMYLLTIPPHILTNMLSFSTGRKSRKLIIPYWFAQYIKFLCVQTSPLTVHLLTVPPPDAEKPQNNYSVKRATKEQTFSTAVVLALIDCSRPKFWGVVHRTRQTAFVWAFGPRKLLWENCIPCNDLARQNLRNARRWNEAREIEYLHHVFGIYNRGRVFKSIQYFTLQVTRAINVYHLLCVCCLHYSSEETEAFIFIGCT